MAGLLGRYFFTRLLTEGGRKAEPLALQQLPQAPGRVHRKVSPQLLCISLLHLGPLFHELHISVQQVQPPLRVPLEHLKLILEGGVGIRNKTLGPHCRPTRRERGLKALGSEKEWLPGPAPARRGGEAGNRREPPPLPGKGQGTGAGPQPDYRVPVA